MDTDIERQFGNAVRRWREKLGISQEQLAKRAGMHRTYICDVERGARGISLRKIQQLADALSVPLISLLSDLAPRSPQVTATLREDEIVDVLLVEDGRVDIELAKDSLKRWNMNLRIFSVTEGVTALNFLFCSGEFSHRRVTDMPKIILLDIGLPKMNGVEVLRRIKADARTSSIPIVMLTGSIDERDIAECRRLGVENYIQKPLSVQSFSEVSLRLDIQSALNSTITN